MYHNINKEIIRIENKNYNNQIKNINVIKNLYFKKMVMINMNIYQKNLRMNK